MNFKIAENKKGEKRVYGIDDESFAGKITVPGGVVQIDEYAFRYCRGLEEVVLPDGLKTIRAGAFENCSRLRRIYIPASVQVIGNDAFCGCKELEIYCGGEPQDGWLDKEETRKEYMDDMTEAFNFHRSGGSFDDLYLVRRVEITHNNYNPDKRPVHVNVSREQFAAVKRGDF